MAFLATVARTVGPSIARKVLPQIGKKLLPTVTKTVGKAARQIGGDTIGEIIEDVFPQIATAIGGAVSNKLFEPQHETVPELLANYGAVAPESLETQLANETDGPVKNDYTIAPTAKEMKKMIPEVPASDLVKPQQVGNNKYIANPPKLGEIPAGQLLQGHGLSNKDILGEYPLEKLGNYDEFIQKIAKQIQNKESKKSKKKKARKQARKAQYATHGGLQSALSYSSKHRTHNVKKHRRF